MSKKQNKQFRNRIRENAKIDIEEIPYFNKDQKETIDVSKKFESWIAMREATQKDRNTMDRCKLQVTEFQEERI